MNTLKLSLILGCLALNACAPSGSGFKPGDALTGKTKTVVDADTNKRVKGEYTIAGFKEAYDALAKKIGAFQDQALADAVASVVVTPVDEKGAVTRLTPKALAVDFKFTAPINAPASLSFKTALTASGKGQAGRTLSADKKFELSVFCYTKSCNRVELVLQRADKSKHRIGVLVSKSLPKIKLVKAKELQDKALRQLESLVSSGITDQTSTVIVNGASESKVSVRSSVIAKPLLTIVAELINTENVVTAVKSVTLDGGVNTNAKLMGNDSSLGDLMFEVISGNEAVALLVEKDPREVEAEEPVVGTRSAVERDLSARAQPETGLFPTSVKNRAGLAMADDFASYGVHKRTQYWIDWIKNNNSRSVKNVFTYTHNVSPYITKIFETMSLTPEFAYLMPVESGYLKGNGTFDAQQVTGAPPSKENPNPSAYGPWQIVNNTAFDIKKRTGLGFNLFFIRKKIANPQDDRGFLIQSTYMAASYLKQLSEMFPQDPGLAVLAYHSGQGHLGSALNKKKMQDPTLLVKIQNLSKRHMTLEYVEKYKMIEQVHRDYAFHFLAWREIGQNPQRYGYDRIQRISTDAFKKRLSRPNAPTPI